MSEQSILLSARGVAAALGYGTRQAYRLLARADAPRPVLVGAGKRWVRDEIDAWAKALPRGDRPGASDESAA